ncbi:hypothetical protein GCM10009696_19620 [Kocuria himachalensis]
MLQVFAGPIFRRMLWFMSHKTFTLSPVAGAAMYPVQFPAHTSTAQTLRTDHCHTAGRARADRHGQTAVGVVVHDAVARRTGIDTAPVALAVAGSW